MMRAFERVWLPLVISAFTTVVGFGSLMVNRITAIWDLGFFAVVGVVFLTITSLTFIPRGAAAPAGGATLAALGEDIADAVRCAHPPRQARLRVAQADPVDVCG